MTNNDAQLRKVLDGVLWRSGIRTRRLAPGAEDVIAARTSVRDNKRGINRRTVHGRWQELNIGRA